MSASKMDLFFDILKKLTKLELIFYNKETDKYDIRPVSIYAVSEDKNEVIVSQTKPPLNKYMEGKELEASFVASIKKDKLERFFFLVKIKKFGFCGLSRNKFAEAIFLMPVKKEIYKRSLRIYPRINCENKSVYVKVDEDKFPVVDISEGGLCFKCEKNIINLMRFAPNKKPFMVIEFPENINITAQAEIIRRFNKEDMLFIGIKFIRFLEKQKEQFVKMIEKLREGKSS